MFEFGEIKSEIEYKLPELKPDMPFTQAWFFGQWQEAMGRKARRFEIKQGEEIIGFFQVINYKLLFSKNLLYIPHGPILKETILNNDFFKTFHDKLFEIAKEENAIFVRFDFYFHNSNYGSRENFDKYFKKVPEYAYYSSYFQPKFEWILNLERPEEEILSEMHSKTRYNIGLAKRRGVEVQIVSENFGKYFNDFYRLLEETARRDNFNLHPKAYYEIIFINCKENKNAFLSVTKYNGKILAINFILLFGKTAYFMHGGSSGEYKNLMAPYSAHWKSILESKQRGFEIYNFGAVDGKFSAQGGPASGWEGISRFKKGFGGELLKYSDSYDLVLKPFWYFLYNLRKWVLNLKLKK